MFDGVLSAHVWCSPAHSDCRARGFGFIEFRDPRDAEEALYHLDRSTFMGREISVSDMNTSYTSCSIGIGGVMYACFAAAKSINHRLLIWHTPKAALTAKSHRLSCF